MGPGLSDVQCESDIERMYDSRRGAEDIASIAALAQGMSSRTDRVISPLAARKESARVDYYYHTTTLNRHYSRCETCTVFVRIVSES